MDLNKGLTAEQFAQLAKKITDTKDDETPFLVMDNDNKPNVIGDANKTEIKKNDYTIKFRLPASMVEGSPELLANAVPCGSEYIVTVDYEDRTITPRQDLYIIESIMQLEPFINKLTESGEVKEMNGRELLSTFVHMGDKVHLAMYRIVGTFLNIDDVLGEYMLPATVITAMTQLIDRHPEVFNEADTFFGFATEDR